MKRSIQGLALTLMMAIPFSTFAQFSNSIQYLRAHDKKGINVFETSKTDNVKFVAPSVRFGAGFTQQFQNLKHSNTALNSAGSSVATAGANKLYPIVPGFMTAQANLFMDCLLYTSPSPRDTERSRMPSSA